MTVIPRVRLAEVLTAIETVAKKEADMRTRMRQGEALADILGMRAPIYPK